MQIGKSLVDPGATACNSQPWGSGGQRSRSQKTEIRFKGLAETSFSYSTPWVELIEAYSEWATGDGNVAGGT